MNKLSLRAWAGLALGGLMAVGASAAPPANAPANNPKAAPAAAPAAAPRTAPATAAPAKTAAAPNNAAPATNARTTPANAAKAAVNNQQNAAGDHHIRASQIESMKVRNTAGEDLGKVKDLVIDMEHGKIDYAALDFGGFLGIGDKLFAVPWSAFHYAGTGRDRHLVLDVSKDRLKNAPGFDKNHWPDMADPKWSHDVDTFYGHPSTAATR